ncbi:MAG: hypothetical protein WCO25_00360 [Candidatus Uhrbacteria bacterium]
MDYRIILPTLVLGATLALAGAGCTGSTPTAKTVVQPAPAVQQAAPAPVVIAPTPVAAVIPACTKAGTVTYVNTDDTNAKWTISLNGKVVATLDHGGEAAVYPWLETPGITYLAFDPTGLGGYIPLGGGHEKLVAVDHCTGTVSTFVEPRGGLGLQLLSTDGSKLISLAQFDGTVGTVTHIYVWDTKSALADAKVAPAHDFTLPDEWGMIGQFTLNADSSKLAFAVGEGPDNEHGAVYTLDLSSGKFAKVQERADGLIYAKGWNANGTVNVSTTLE